jgi:histidinol phosphatase-like enzyme
MNLKIIFLDMDGVLNSERYYKSAYRKNKDWSRFDLSAVVLVKKLIEEYSLMIVITSTLRYGAANQLRTEFRRNKLTSFLHKDWSTPSVHSAHCGSEIKLWLDKHSEVSEY